MIVLIILYMSKNLNSGHNGMMNRKYCWDQLVISLKDQNIKKVLDQNIKIEDKQSILKQILNIYIGSLKNKGIDNNIVKNTNSYKLLADLCLAHPKRINNCTFSGQWDNLLSHALKKSYNCRNH